MSVFYNPDDPADIFANASTRRSEAFRRATVLASAGLRDDAENELSSLRHTIRNDPGALLAFAEASWGIGVPRAAMRAISALKAKTGKPILSGETPLRQR